MRGKSPKIFCMPVCVCFTRHSCTSAYAGNMRHLFLPFRRLMAHPRICGEYGEFCTATSNSEGSPPHMRGIILLYPCADIYMLICCSPYSQNAPVSHYQIRLFAASKRIRILLTNCIWSVSGPQLIRTEHSDCSAAMPIAVST